MPVLQTYGPLYGACSLAMLSLGRIMLLCLSLCSSSLIGHITAGGIGAIVGANIDAIVEGIGCVIEAIVEVIGGIRGDREGQNLLGFLPGDAHPAVLVAGYGPVRGVTAQGLGGGGLCVF